MDEPCSALDPTSTRRIEETIHELSGEAEPGTPGAIVEHGPTDAVCHSPQDPRAADYVGGRFG